MHEQNERIGPDGKPAQDVTVNPMAVERRKREASDRERAEREAAEPWSREKLIRALAQVDRDGVQGVVNGKELRDHVNLHGVDLSGLDLSGLDLARANMHGVKAIGTNFSGCRLVEANLNDAILTGAILDGVNAVEATFHGACLCSIKASKAQFMGANMSECCVEAVEGMDITEKPLTAAELNVAKHKQAEGFKVEIRLDETESGEAKAMYFGENFLKANVHNLVTTCKRREKS